MSLVRTIYTGLMRRTSTFVLSVVVGAVFFERAFDLGGDAIYDKINAGKQWKDIKHKYVKNEDSEEIDE